MALYIPHSIFHLAWLLYVRPETFGPYYVRSALGWDHGSFFSAFIIHSCSSFSSLANAEMSNRLKSTTPITIQLTNYFWGEAN